MPPRLVSVAPMLDWTDRHDRYFLRQISRRALLYTEMITTGALLHGDRQHLIGYHPVEHPLALQLGGSHPGDLARCARIAESEGFDEVNLNVGCPSERVQSGRFGACLMREPELLGECVAAMNSVVRIPVTVKTRIGVDEHDSYEALAHLVQCLAVAGNRVFIVHARKAWLQGLSPKQNRELPPLRYEVVCALKRDFPSLVFVLNGGITSIKSVGEHLQRVDGVMLGRAAYHNPFLLAPVDQLFYGESAPMTTRHEVAERMIPYLHRHLESGGKAIHVVRHMLGLFQGCPGARAWRRFLSCNVHRTDRGAELLSAALALVPEPAESTGNVSASL